MLKESAMPFIRFETRPVEDRQESMRTGKFITKDVDYIIIVPLGSGGKEQIEQRYDEWLAQRKAETGRNEIRQGDSATPMFAARFPDEWLEKVERGYAAWKAGQEIPVEGTPLAQWAVLSPGQRQTLIGQGVMTVEQLAELPDSGLDTFGIGGMTLRSRARDFIKLNSGEAAKTAGEMEKLRTENASLKGQLEALLKRVEKMEKAA